MSSVSLKSVSSYNMLCHLIITLLLLVNLGEGTEDCREIVLEEMEGLKNTVSDLIESLSTLQANHSSLQASHSTLKASHSTLQENHSTLLANLSTTIEEITNENSYLKANVSTLQTTHATQHLIIEEQQTRIEEIEKENSFLKDPPVAFSCSYRSETRATSSPVTYDSLYYSRTNALTEEGGMDLNSGLYTSPYPGTYTITYSMWVSDTYSKYTHQYRTDCL